MKRFLKDTILVIKIIGSYCLAFSYGLFYSPTKARQKLDTLKEYMAKQFEK